MLSKEYDHMSDQALLQKCKEEKDNRWLGILLERYTLLLLGVCLKYLKNQELAKDAVQQVFLKAIAEMNKYPIAYPKSWLYMVAKNHCLMELRSKKQVVSLGEEQVIAESDTDFQEFIEKEKALNHLSAALISLNEPQRTCIELFYLNQKTYQEIVDLTGYPYLQVKSHIQNGKRNLRLTLEKQMNH